MPVCIQLLLHETAAGNAELMLATHNQGSVEAAVEEMHAQGLHPSESPVAFAQLLGMSDHLTQV